MILVKRRKRIHNESTNGNVFVCASNITGNSNNESVVFVNNTGQTSGKNLFIYFCLLDGMFYLYINRW